MNTFIFQSMPERFDLREKLIVNEKDTWYATRYRNKMQPGDLVFFWMGGDKRFRGIYGWGNITSKPYIKNNWDTYGVDVEYQVKFEKPITSSKIISEPSLSELLIFRAPQATNFIVNDFELKKLLKLINKAGEESPKIQYYG
ncbi:MULTISPECIES: EVE domain-containing protein [unclassified Leeuwenhoekiella]|uniref:EVE domain-containing protein n=1 Tax=unclassified Leeuwenhoekiella TaxID=2615029 RepID=UPI0025B8740D|nr:MULTISPECIES: EVE domain-containing protein [unclassified Leeuwenhoekiella]